MKILTIIFFAIMCIAQWAIPGRMIFQSEDVISSGTLYKFKTEPVDPSDPFRGKYIVLNFKEDFVTDTVKWISGESTFVIFKNDAAGFAKASRMVRETPSDGAYLSTKVLYTDSYNDQSTFKTYFVIPFNRLYLEESKAQAAEDQYRVSQRDTTSTTYGVVRMGKGQAVLVDVMIDDKSIIDVVRELNQK